MRVKNVAAAIVPAATARWCSESGVDPANQWPGGQHARHQEEQPEAEHDANADQRAQQPFGDIGQRRLLVHPRADRPIGHRLVGNDDAHRQHDLQVVEVRQSRRPRGRPVVDLLDQRRRHRLPMGHHDVIVSPPTPLHQWQTPRRPIMQGPVDRHPAVMQAATVGIPEELRGETVKACIALDPDADAGEEDLLASCRERLVRYKLSTVFEFHAELPGTGPGKIDKLKLKGAR
jgi:hypothetical protein